MAVDALPGWEHLYSGKVRDLYRPADGPQDLVLVVASDRISAYDHILPTLIPDKGKILTALSLWWFEILGVPNHVVSVDVPAAVAGRAMVCRRLQMYPVECVARGYLTGSGLTEYRQAGAVCAVPLPPGLVDGSKLLEAIFTPATKAAVGDHDENVSFDRVVADLGGDVAHRLRDLTLSTYSQAAEIAAGRGVILADTKFEFGTDHDGALLLGDEVLTPDSSRYWPAEDWHPGRPQPSFDKQFVRDWLRSASSGWDRHGQAPPPPLPMEVVERTRDRYVEAYQRLTGRQFG
ncbi:MAG: phosphoribosylaminoimidazolesuccinocarboxamide synthase [Beutenbergiaceae bacterium]